MDKRAHGKHISIKNRKAEFEYFLISTFTAGLVLVGTEIKAIREGKVNLVDSYCSFINQELWVHNLHIGEYSHGSYSNHLPRRDRKLLLQRKELRKLFSKLNDRGTTIIPVSLFINEKGYAKLDIALARGKKMYDKRESIKEKDQRREKARMGED
ncbi:MAG: SsrA-binding protein SmpB [Bacteroidales bacterium]|jgi:SsrA-binding protein|nr:SsrA-binding protein SmpB [Bacteroidales bacterium]